MAQEERLSDAEYYAKISAEAGEVGKDFGDVQPFPVMYDGWFANNHEWMGSDGETLRQVFVCVCVRKKKS